MGVLKSYAPLAIPVLTRRLGVWKRRKLPQRRVWGVAMAENGFWCTLGLQNKSGYDETSAGGERVTICTTTCRLAQAVAYILTKKLEEFVMICAKNLRGFKALIDTPLAKSCGCHDTMTPPGSLPMPPSRVSRGPSRSRPRHVSMCNCQ